MATITRACWANVTVAEYAALRLLQQPGLLARCNAYWDQTWQANPFRGETPTRFTPAGEAWLVQMQSIVSATTDEHDLIRAARAVVAELGTLMVMGLTRRL